MRFFTLLTCCLPIFTFLMNSFSKKPPKPFFPPENLQNGRISCKKILNLFYQLELFGFGTFLVTKFCFCCFFSHGRKKSGIAKKSGCPLIETNKINEINIFSNECVCFYIFHWKAIFLKALNQKEKTNWDANKINIFHWKNSLTAPLCFRHLVQWNCRY